MPLARPSIVAPAAFQVLPACWVCQSRSLARFHEARFDFEAYRVQDPELAAYTGERVWLVRCLACGFAQPEALPVLPAFFDRMYDQHWSEDWVESEFEARYKDFIFHGVLRELDRRTASGPRTLLDVGAHAGRFLHLAQQRGWTVEGIELNPRTAAAAARRTGATVHRINAHALAATTRRYGAVTLIDVLEHIPDPITLLNGLSRLLEPGGWIAVKVPCGPSQLLKERVRASMSGGREIAIAGNLVHVNHFSATSLQVALKRAGFQNVTVQSGAPELLPLGPDAWRGAASNVLRLAVYAAARLPGAVQTPLALNLQAYAQSGSGS
jgi:SAM-dependent methyltransferase